MKPDVIKVNHIMITVSYLNMVVNYQTWLAKVLTVSYLYLPWSNPSFHKRAQLNYHDHGQETTTMAGNAKPPLANK